MAYTYPTYDPARGECSGGPMPGTKALRSECMRLFPEVVDLGIYNCRVIAGTTILSVHGKGRAWDGGIAAGRRALGDALAAALVAAAPALGLQEIIWWERRWTSTTGEWRPYTGKSKHRDHVHAAQNAVAGAELTPQAARAALTAALSPTPTPPTAEATMFPILHVSEWTGVHVVDAQGATWVATDEEVAALAKRLAVFDTSSAGERFSRAYIGDRRANVDELTLDQERAQTMYLAAINTRDAGEAKR